MFHVIEPLFKVGVITWLSGGTKTFPRKERNSRAASTSSGCAHCWDTTESTHNRAWHKQGEKTEMDWRKARVCLKTGRNFVKKNIPEKWPGVLCFLLKQLILTEAAVKYSAAQGVSAPAVDIRQLPTFIFVCLCGLCCHLVWAHS